MYRFLSCSGASVLFIYTLGFLFLTRKELLNDS